MFVRERWDESGFDAVLEPDMAMCIEAFVGAKSGGEGVARHDAPSIFAGHYDPSFPLSLCLKDLGLLADLESSIGADLPIAAAARSAFERAAQRYGVDAGEMCVARRIADDAQSVVSPPRRLDSSLGEVTRRGSDASGSTDQRSSLASM